MISVVGNQHSSQQEACRSRCTHPTLCHVRLVFGGGTALSRAHRLIRRMSEDIDLRIVVDSNRPERGTLRRLRAKVTEALLGAGL
jgi:hypothetical protein